MPQIYKEKKSNGKIPSWIWDQIEGDKILNYMYVFPCIVQKWI